MRLSLNETQLAVLQWIADGCDLEHLPTPAYKQSAIALRDRGLIELDRRRGRWAASLDPKGRFYLEHGRHPDDESVDVFKQNPHAEGAIGATEPVPILEASAALTDESLATPPRKPSPPKVEVRDGTIPMPSQIRKPHPALRELIDYKKRLDVPAEQQQRALQILHALVQESIRRGWTVTPVLSTMREDSWARTRTRVWPSADLFNIDAGHSPAAIRVRMKGRRVDHVLTDKELKEKERRGYSWAPKHDYVPTEKMRLEIGAGTSGSLVLEDTVATRLEDKLLRAIERIQKLSNDELAREEQRRRRAIAEAEARKRADEIRVRATAYGKWVNTLEGLRDEFLRHRDLTAVVDGLRDAAPRFKDSERYAELQAYLGWAEQHLLDSDPFRRILLPTGERPNLRYEEWRDWNARNPQWRR